MRVDPPEELTLNCTCCDVATRSADARVFEAVYLCSTCHDRAQVAMRNLTREIKMLELLGREMLRRSLVERTFMKSDGAPQATHDALVKGLLTRL